VLVDPPLYDTVAPEIAAPLVLVTVPEIVPVLPAALKFTPETFAPFTVTVWLEGVKLEPDWFGTTV
jgi:hypothetical protein